MSETLEARTIDEYAKSKGVPKAEIARQLKMSPQHLSGLRRRDDMFFIGDYFVRVMGKVDS